MLVENDPQTGGRSQSLLIYMKMYNVHTSLKGCLNHHNSKRKPLVDDETKDKLEAR